MFKTVKRIIMSASMLAMLLTPALVPATASAADSAIQNGLTCGTELNPQNIDGASSAPCESESEDASTTVENIVKLVINIFSWIVGIIAVIMIIVGGLKYITSSGDSGNVTGAKNTILYAVVGLVVVALAQFVVRFVLDKVKNAS
jgi:hypothetical protein